MFEVLPLDHPILKKKAKVVKKVNKEVKELAYNMVATMLYLNGAGISAPQVGHSLRVIVILLDNLQVKVMINPEIVQNGGQFVRMEEGCLSAPGDYREIVRPEAVKVKFKNIDKSVETKDFTGMAARAIQHEIDHLNGVLFTER